MYGPRRTGSSSRRSSIARIFGAPVIEPPGKRGGEQVERVAARREAAGDGRDEVLDGRGPLEPAQARHADACPGRQTRPRSLRRTSTIITFSARSLRRRQELARERAVLVAGRGRAAGCP